MKPAHINSSSNQKVTLPKALTFQHIFQSCPYWTTGIYGFLPEVVKLLRQNEHQQSYLIRLNDRSLVLSIAEGNAPFFDPDSQSINPIIEHAAEANIGPRQVFNSGGKGFVVSEYLEGHCWTTADFQKHENIERLSELLKRLHDLPGQGPTFIVRKTEQQYWAEIRREALPIPKRLHGMQLRMQKVLNYAQNNYQTRVPSHNHLLTSHVIEAEGGLRLVGWEMAALNDPFYDLVVVAHNHKFDEKQIDRLLSCYAGNAGFEEKKHFYHVYAIYIYLDALHYRTKAPYKLAPEQTQVIDGHVDTLMVLLNRLGM